MTLKLLLGALKKKKTQSVAILIMLGFTLAFIIVSIQLVFSSTVLIQDFVDMSSMSTVIVWKEYNIEDSGKLEKLEADKSYIKGIQNSDAISIDSADITLYNGSDVFSSFSCFVTAYDSENNKIFSVVENEDITLGSDEIAIPIYFSRATRLGIDDKLTITVNDVAFEYTVKYIFKDALFGSEYISTKRLIVSENSLNDMLAVCTPENRSSFIGVNLSDENQTAALISAFTEYDLPISFNLDRNFLMQVYGASNGIIAVLFLIVALFIGVIAFVVQRYSVQSTLEDEYKNIGLMKATGFKNRQIISIYLYKYLFINICGLVFGAVVGIGFSTLLLNDYFEFIVVSNKLKLWMVTFAGIALVGVMYMVISYFYLRRIYRLSPIEIKDNREAKNKTALVALSLSKISKVNSLFILAINDFIQNFRHFLKITGTLLLSFALLIAVGNLKSTINSSDFLSYFGLTVGDIYLDLLVEDYDTEKINNTVEKLNGEMLLNGEPVEFGVDFYVDSRIVDINGISAPITALKSAASTSEFRYIRGTAPRKENEIALTNVLAQRYDVDIGDTIMLEVEDVRNEYTITAINQALFNMGEIILLPDDYSIKSEKASYRIIAFVDAQDKNKTIIRLKSQYEFMDGLSKGEIINSLTGNMVDQIVLAINMLMLFILLFVAIVLVLFSKMICLKDSPALKQLYDMGASNSFLFSYQQLKLTMSFVLSILIGIVCAVTLGKAVVVRIFTLTGLAKFTLNTNPVNTFVLMPVVFLVIAMIVTGITQWQFIKKHTYEER